MAVRTSLMEFQIPRIVHEEVEDNRGGFVIEPLDRGFGETFGASLRRAVLAPPAGGATRPPPPRSAPPPAAPRPRRPPRPRPGPPPPPRQRGGRPPGREGDCGA